MLLLTGVRLPTASAGFDLPVTLTSLPSPTAFAMTLSLPLVSSLRPGTESENVGGAPLLYKVLPGTVSSRSYATAPFEFRIFPAPELHDTAAVGSDNLALVPLTLAGHDLTLDPTPAHTSIKFNDLILVSDVPPYLPKRDYFFEFGVEPTVIRIPYVFDFAVLAKAAEGSFEFNIQSANRTRITYDQWVFDVVLTNKYYAGSGLFAFDVKQPRIPYDFEFNVTQSLTSYDFSFVVSSQVKQTVDFELDVIESWVPVTLVCSATPLPPGLISPSTRKHRLNIRVYAGSILVGAGYTYYLWNGAGDARVCFTIGGIPQLSADHRVLVYDNILKVYDETLPYSEFWSDSYGNS